MQDYRKTSHGVYDIKYHVVWITKYRKPVLCGEVAIRVRDLIREICKSMDVEIIKGHVSKDHLHILVSAPPHLAVSKLVQRLKSKTSRRLMSEYKRLAKQFSISDNAGSRLAVDQLKPPPFRRWSLHSLTAPDLPDVPFLR